MAIAMARNVMDGKALKKTRPRRTVDYGAMIGRWILVRIYILIILLLLSTFGNVLEPKVATESEICAVHSPCASICCGRML